MTVHNVLKLGFISLILVVASPIYASNEKQMKWYATGIGNALVINSNFGCIDKDMMYEKHIIEANTWNDTWIQGSRDYGYEFAFFSSGSTYNSDTPVIKVHTTQVHQNNGSTLDIHGNTITHTVYVIRKYEVLTGRRDRNATNSFWGIRSGLSLDVECSTL